MLSLREEQPALDKNAERGRCYCKRPEDDATHGRASDEQARADYRYDNQGATVIRRSFTACSRANREPISRITKFACVTPGLGRFGKV